MVDITVEIASYTALCETNVVAARLIGMYPVDVGSCWHFLSDTQRSAAVTGGAAPFSPADYSESFTNNPRWLW